MQKATKGKKFMAKLPGMDKERSPVNENDRHWASLLVKQLQEKRLLQRKVNADTIKKWAGHFKKLRKVDEISPDRIDNVLRWYVNHMRDKYTPKAFSAKTFRNKFLDIEQAKERDKKQMDLTL